MIFPEKTTSLIHKKSLHRNNYKTAQGLQRGTNHCLNDNLKNNISLEKNPSRYEYKIIERDEIAQ